MKKTCLFTVPNLLTLTNLLLGAVAIVFALRFDDVQTAFWLIAAAAAFDFLDGLAARLLGQYSSIGKELDSLADMVSFGVAPSAVLFSLYQAEGGIGVWGYAVFVVAAFSALRLARFNTDDSQSDAFLGLPTPACALLIASAGYLHAAGLFSLPTYYILLSAGFLALLMVVPVRMFSLKFRTWGWRDNQVRWVFLAASLVSLAIWQITAVPLIILGYVLVSVCLNLACRGRSC